MVRNGIILLGLMGALSVAPQSARAQDEQFLEYQVKAAFLLNFVKFVEWPVSSFPDAESPIFLCILGGDPFGSALDQLTAGEVVNGRKVAIRRIKRAPPAKSCQVVFFGKAEKNVAQILPTLGAEVLTVGEGENFVRAGGMITFVVEKRRVRFDVNQPAAENSSLKISSKLLGVARFVEK